MKKGIDVSYAQGKINWKKVKESDFGVEFAIIRAGYGKNGKCAVDTCMQANVRGCEEQKIPYGFYFYTYAKTVDQAVAQADFFVDTVKEFRPEYPLYLDLEDPSLQPLGREKISAIASAFCERVAQRGWCAGIYANLYWLHTYLTPESIAPYEIWLAQWRKEPTYEGTFGMWQNAVLGTRGEMGVDYTAYGSIDGIDTAVDIDRVFKDYPALIRQAGLNHLDSAAEPENPQEPSEPEGGDSSGEDGQTDGSHLTTLGKFIKLIMKFVRSILNNFSK